MRRLFAGCVQLNNFSFIAREPRRFVRKRGSSRQSEAMASIPGGKLPSEPAFDLSGLRTGGAMAAPPSTTSLDTIRSEINAMRKEAQVRAEEEKLRKQRAIFAEQAAIEEQVRNGKQLVHSWSDSHEHEDTRSLDLLSSYRRLNKPNDVFYFSREIDEGLAAADSEMRKAFLGDLDEVVRPKNNGVTQQYANILFTHLVRPNARSKELQSLLDEVVAEHAKQLAALKLESEDVEADPEVGRLTWLSTLAALDERRIRQLWQFSILDGEVIEDLLVTSENDEADVDVEEDAGLPMTMLQERIDGLRRIHTAHDITTAIRDTALAGSPSIDLAPVLQKAKKQEFDDITEKELKQLEKFEESIDPLVVEKLRKSEYGQLLSRLSLSDALLERALNPSNKLLYAVADIDADLRASLEGLERIKREALLDPIFQEAVSCAHALEEDSVDGLVRGASPTAKAKDPERKRQSASASRARGQRGTLNMGRGPMARSAHAADIPYFYNSVRSVVPRRGSFNLPAPALSKEERAALRGKRKQQRGRTRFGR